MCCLVLHILIMAYRLACWVVTTNGMGAGYEGISFVFQELPIEPRHSRDKLEALYG